MSSLLNEADERIEDLFSRLETCLIWPTEKRANAFEGHLLRYRTITSVVTLVLPYSGHYFVFFVCYEMLKRCILIPPS